MVVRDNVALFIDDDTGAYAFDRLDLTEEVLTAALRYLPGRRTVEASGRSVRS